MKLSVIILSYAIDEEVYQMNCRAIESLFASEEWSKGEPEVLLMESNREAKYTYDARVRVSIPEEKFRFHRFFNIGLDNTSGEYVAFCNNDIVFQPGWWSAIQKVKAQHPKFMCFSPVDSSYPMMAEEIAKGKDYVIGWGNKRHFAAWCFVWERKVFKTIGRFDETFDFYSADDDELQTLHYWAIPNVLVTSSEVKHLSQVVTEKMGTGKYAVKDKEKYPLSEYEIMRGKWWVWKDVRFYLAYRREVTKWGNHWMRKRVNQFLERHPRMNVRLVTKFLYSRRVNMILARLTGVADPKPVNFSDQYSVVGNQMKGKILILQDGLFNSPDANAKLVWRLSEHLVGLGYDVTMLSKANDKEHVVEYHGVHLIHEPVDIAIRERKLTERLGKWKWLRYLISWRAIDYRLNKENIDPFVIEMRRWLGKHVNEYDALMACCSPYYPILLASEVADRIPVIYYKIDPMGSWGDKTRRDTELSTVENEVKWDNVAMKIMMPDVVYKDYMRLETKVNGEKVTIVQFPNVRKLTIGDLQLKIEDWRLKNENQVNLLFVGKFYADIRHPQYLFDLMEKLAGTGIVLHIVGPINYMGFDKEYIEKYFTNKKENIRFHGAVPPPEADALLTQADVLVHVGNSVDTAMPSKILDYISSGKPILNICKIRTCPTIPLMERYPLGLTLFEPSTVSSQLSVVSDEIVKQVKDFCMKNKGKQVPYEQIEKLYPECTIEYVGKQFDEAIQDAIKEFKLK